jgi:uncharacterized protein (TIGR02145 family)
MKRIIILIAVLVFGSWGCKKDPIIDPSDPVMLNLVTNNKNTQSDPNTPGPIDYFVPLPKDFVPFEFKDFDNNVYHAIKIGELIWSKENLKVTHYNDGTQIPNIVSADEWKSISKGAYCHYDNNPSNSERFGLLYNHYTVATKKLAPEGWHVATAEEWDNLNQVISEYCGTLADAQDWNESYFFNMKDVTSKCNNSSGFTALPNGYRDFHWNCWIRNINGPVVYELNGYQACWWASNGVYYLDSCWGLWRGDVNDRVIGGAVRLVKDY